MELLDLTLDTPAENVALDEALLERAERSGGAGEVLRLWESPQPMVVVGRSSRVDAEVDRSACRRLGIPVVRRSSGGAAVLAGPGCLMYAVVLGYEHRPPLQLIDRAHRFVLETMARAIEPIVSGVAMRGVSDLALDDERKFSGNSMRCRRRHLLYHGTLLYDFPIELIGQCLKTAPRQPEYRQGREHGAFVTNIPATGDQLRRALVGVWNPAAPMAKWPRLETEGLVHDKYGREAWNLRIL